MQQIVVSVLKGISSIPIGVVQDIGEEIFFPKTKYAPEAECQGRIKKQGYIIRYQADDMSGLNSELMESERENARQKRELDRKDKQIQLLEKKHKSTEFELRQQIERHKRKR